ncbi:MAG TPA: IS200/IS605 family transposase [Ignavibacteria bacterium]|nr:IS200/IS605 family transposase [Ignavibacteria bacterium]
MSTYTQILYHITFATKQRRHALKKENRTKLFKYIWGLLENKNCHLYRVNGVEEHLHIVTHLHPTIALSDLIKDIKLSTIQFIKSEKLFPNFDGWQEGYGAFTHSLSDKDRLIEYVKNQEEHHMKVSFKEEYIKLLKEHKIDFNEKFLI